MILATAFLCLVRLHLAGRCSQTINHFQHVLAMRVRFNFAKDVRDFALLINNESGAQHALHDLAVHVFFAPRTVLFHHAMIWISE
jgi:hypothetical protein